LQKAENGKKKSKIARSVILAIDPDLLDIVQRKPGLTPRIIIICTVLCVLSIFST
jgi:hypothetical protein